MQILLIDDEKPVVEVSEMLLKTLGHQVVAEVNPSRALEIFVREPDAFDLVITDLNMDGLSGEMLAAEMKRIRPDLPVIACTGDAARMPPNVALENGFAGVLAKPFTKLELQRALEKYTKSECFQ